MTTLRVMIHRRGTRYGATAETSAGRTLCVHRFEHNPTGLTRLGPLWLVERSSLAEEDRAKLGRFGQKTTSVAHVAQYGHQLFRYIFGDGEAFDTYLQKQVGDEPVELIIHLGLDAIPLWKLPWEYLHDGRSFLGLDERFRVSRLLGPLSTLTPQSAPAPLRVLVAMPSPTDQPVLNYERELASIHEALSESIENGNVQLHVLFEATTPAIYDALQRYDYHVFHYLGQGRYDLEQRQGFLKVESEIGTSEWINAQEFADLIKGRGLHLVVLQAYQDAPVGMIDAFNEIASKALRRDIPEVLTVPIGLPQSLSQALQREFYAALGSGSSALAAVQQIRQTFHRIDRTQDAKHRRFDWGMPILYRRTEPYELIHREVGKSDAGRKVNQAHDLRPPLANRTKEIRAIKAALQDGGRTLYIWGRSGIGKSRLITHWLQRPGVRIQEHLVIQCTELEDPMLAFDRIATFWRSHATERHIRAADMLQDSTKDPFERALQAQAYLSTARYAIILEDIEAWFEAPRPDDADKTEAKIVHDLLHNLLLGLLSAEARTIYLLTGQRRWADFHALPVEDRREIHLPLLQKQPAIQLMNTLPGLSRASHEIKKALYWHLGGHPEVLVLASGWVRAGHDLKALVADPPIANRELQAWIEYFVRELIHALDPGERQVLEAAAVLNRPFTAEQLSELTSIAQHYAAPLIKAWLTLGLVERASDTEQPRYRFHTSVRSFIIDRLTSEDILALHRQAASYYRSPFLDAARRQALIRSGTVWSDARVAWLARDSNGILGLWLRRESDPQRKRRTIVRALAWHHHLLQAEAFEEASQIAHTLAPVLDQEGQRDLSRLLLQQSLATDGGFQRAESMDTLAKLRLQDGHLQSALDVYEEVVASLSGNKNNVQRAYILIRAGKIKQQMQKPGEAIDHYQRALKLMREEENVEGEAQALYRLSTIYRETGNARQALVHSQAAMECYQRLDHEQGIALIHYEQGLSLKALSRDEPALERFTSSLEIARQLSDRVAIASTLIQIGEIFQRLGEEQRAIRAMKEAASHYARLQSPREQEILSRLESIYAQQEQFEQAVTRFREARNKPET